MGKRKNRRQILLSCYAVAAAVILAALIACMGSLLKAKAVTAVSASDRVISVICVKEGDTLWSIAADFYTEEYEDISAFIREIERCNGISDHIRIGQNLYVPHYRN